MKKKYIVTLTEAERQMLQAMLSRGKAAARKLMHARILLKADASPGGPGWSDDAIAEGLEVGRATVERVRRGVCGRRSGGGVGASQAPPPIRAGVGWRRRSASGGLGLPAKPPEGRSRWTLRLLADRMVQLEYVEQVSNRHGASRR